MIRHIRYWLLLKIAGKSTVVINASMRGGALDLTGKRGLVYGCSFESVEFV